MLPSVEYAFASPESAESNPDEWSIEVFIYWAMQRGKVPGAFPGSLLLFSGIGLLDLTSTKTNICLDFPGQLIIQTNLNSCKKLLQMFTQRKRLIVKKLYFCTLVFIELDYFGNMKEIWKFRTKRFQYFPFIVKREKALAVNTALFSLYFIIKIKTTLA